VAEPGRTLTIFTAEPGSPSHDALHLLASWTASEDGAVQSAIEEHRSGAIE
jgi:hypothetical protein